MPMNFPGLAERRVGEPEPDAEAQGIGKEEEEKDGRRQQEEKAEQVAALHQPLEPAVGERQWWCERAAFDGHPGAPGGGGRRRARGAACPMPQTS